MSLRTRIKGLLLESIGLALQCLFVAGIVLIPSLSIWWLSSLDFFPSTLVAYGFCTAFALLSQTGMTLVRRAIGTQPLETRATKEILSSASRGSSGLQPVYTALHRFAQGLLWPALVVHQFRHVNDYRILRDCFGVRVAMLLFPSDVVLSILTACIAVLMCAWPSLSLSVRIVVIGCLVEITARHLAYALSPVSLRDVFRGVPGNVFAKLVVVGVFDLVTLIAVYAVWTNNAWTLPTVESFAGTIAQVLTLEAPIESLFGVNSHLRARLQTLSTMLYYLAVGRVMWPPKNLARTTQDLIGIGTRLAFQGKYDEALRWLHAINEPDTTAIFLVAHCHLGKGELEHAIAYANRSAPSTVPKADFSYFVLFNSVRMLELPDGYLATGTEVRRRLRALMQENTNRLLLDHAADSEVTDAVMWLGYVSFSLFGPVRGAQRDESVATLLDDDRFPLSRAFAKFEVIEQEHYFVRGMEERGIELNGLEARKAELEDALRELCSDVLAGHIRGATDGLLKHCMALMLSYYTKDQDSEFSAYMDEHFNRMKRLLTEMQNDSQRILAIQTLQTFAGLTALQPSSAKFTERLDELSQRTAISLESVPPWWAEMFVAAIRQEKLNATNPEGNLSQRHES